MTTDTADELAQWRRPLSDITAMHLILTLRCNYRCTFCFQPNFHDDLPEAIWRTALNDVYANLDELVLHGGEPTIGRSFNDFCKMFTQRNTHGRLSIFTNGLLFDERWTELMLHRGGFVNFSINAATRATYENVNRQDKFDSVVANATRFRSAIDEHASPVKLDLSIVITPSNAHEIAEFLHLASEIGAHRVRYFFDLDNLPEASAQIRDTLELAYATSRQLPALQTWGLQLFDGRLFGQPVDEPFLESTGCTRTFDNIYIGVNGDVSFCTFLHARPIGNLNTAELQDIWNSPSALAQRRAQAEQRWDYCMSAYCGPTENLSRPSSGVFIPIESISSRSGR